MKTKILTIKLTETEYQQLSQFICDHAITHNKREHRMKTLLTMCDEEGIEIPDRVRQDYKELVAVGETVSKFTELFPKSR